MLQITIAILQNQYANTVILTLCDSKLKNQTISMQIVSKMEVLQFRGKNVHNSLTQIAAKKVKSRVKALNPFRLSIFFGYFQIYLNSLRELQLHANQKQKAARENIDFEAITRSAFIAFSSACVRTHKNNHERIGLYCIPQSSFIEFSFRDKRD